MQTLAVILRSSIAFAIVSTAAFAVWVFGGPWFHLHGGETAMYAACCLVFLLLAGLLLRPALRWPGGLLRFYGFFLPAFLLYALAWCAAWFSLGAGRGEWIASLIGSMAFTIAMAAALRGWRAWPVAAMAVFIGHSAGYFAGELVCYRSLHSTASELAWGLLYGIGFGAGIGYAFTAMQRSSWKPQLIVNG
ncbi:MAG: hypothetical protein ACKVY0_07995 [Prosthecobacter sp.]|uniref:hypothetical protein n=1 Tax=Prosthecobacter sp. TaxID=1965333 RepID=UPI0039012D0D